MTTSIPAPAAVPRITSHTAVLHPEVSYIAAIDVETATQAPGSICQLAVSRYLSSVIETRTWLIRPPDNRYSQDNIRVHGITPTDTEGCPEFGDIWKHAVNFIDRRMVVAHNMKFDYSQLDAACRRDGVLMGVPQIGCTMRLADLVLADRTAPYKLGSLCETFNIPLDDAHDAGADAAATLQLAGALFEASLHNSERTGKGRAAVGLGIEDLFRAANHGWKERQDARVRRVRDAGGYGANEPATENQLRYARSLAAKAGETVPDGLTKGEASRLIDRLKS